MKRLAAAAAVLAAATVSQLQQSPRQPDLYALQTIILDEETHTQRTLEKLHGKNSYRWSIEPVTYSPSHCLTDTSVSVDSNFIQNLGSLPNAVMLMPDGTAAVAVLSYFTKEDKATFLSWRLRLYHWDGLWLQTRPALRAVLVVQDDSTPRCLHSDF